MDENFWSAIGAIGQWVGAIGTLIAVIVALIIARYPIKPKLMIIISTTKHRDEDGKVQRKDVLKVTNIGQAPVTIESATIMIADKKVDPFGGYRIKLGPDKHMKEFPCKLHPTDTVSCEFDLLKAIHFFNKYLRNKVKGKTKFVFFINDSAGQKYVKLKKINVDLELFLHEFTNKNRELPLEPDSVEFGEFLIKVTTLIGGFLKPYKLLRLYWKYDKKKIFQWNNKS